MAESGANDVLPIQDCSSSSRDTFSDFWWKLQEVLPKAESGAEKTSDWPTSLQPISYDPQCFYRPPEGDFHLFPSPSDQFGEEGFKCKSETQHFLLEAKSETEKTIDWDAILEEAIKCKEKELLAMIAEPETQDSVLKAKSVTGMTSDWPAISEQEIKCKEKERKMTEESPEAQLWQSLKAQKKKAKRVKWRPLT